MRKRTTRTLAWVLGMGLLVGSQPAAAFEPVRDPARFDYFVPLSQKQAFSVREMYDVETVERITRHVTQLALDTNDPKAWEVVCQWTYLWWRLTEDPEDKVKIARAGYAAAQRLLKLQPDSEAGLVFDATMLALLVLTRGVLNTIQAGTKIRRVLERLLERKVRYFFHYPYWALGRLYFKAPPFPLSFGDLHKSEALLEEVLRLEPNWSIAYLFLAETKAALAKGAEPEVAERKMAEFHELLARIPKLKTRTYFERYALWPVIHEAKALVEVVTAGTYDKYTWDPLLVPYPPPPPDW